jgi:hypothetical protein
VAPDNPQVAPQQSTDIERRHFAAGLAPGRVEEWLEPGVEVTVNIAWQSISVSCLHPGQMGTQTQFLNAKVVLGPVDNYRAAMTAAARKMLARKLVSVLS